MRLHSMALQKGMKKHKALTAVCWLLGVKLGAYSFMWIRLTCTVAKPFSWFLSLACHTNRQTTGVT